MMRHVLEASTAISLHGQNAGLREGMVAMLGVGRSLALEAGHFSGWLVELNASFFYTFSFLLQFFFFPFASCRRLRVAKPSR